MVTQVTNDVLGNNSVSTNNIANAAVTATKIANGAITGTAIASNSIDGTKIALGSDAQGDVMYYNGTDWARLPAGTSGYFLKTQGTNANPMWDQAAWAGTESAAANGYVTFPSGIKLEWGSSASIAANSNETVTFPSAYTTAVYSITVTATGTANNTTTGITAVNTVSTTGFTINNGDDDARVFYWQAIGK